MAYIANPIYDVVFKYLLEDERVARILLSALLQKDVVELEMRRHEYTDMTQARISLFRIDFAAKIRNSDGSERLVLIELQKTWLATETLRFRQYLGVQYLNSAEETREQGYGLPIISIYILGHKLGDLQEPVVYVRRQYLDYDSRLITTGVPDPFIESLTHDSIIVQIPYLKSKARNRLERLLYVFDQEYAVKGNEHLLKVDEKKFQGNEEQLVFLRLLQAVAEPEVRRAMMVEDEILSEIEARDTTIMQKDEKIQEQDEKIQEQGEKLQQQGEKIQQQDERIQQQGETIQQQGATIQQQDETIQQQQEIIRSVIPLLAAGGLGIADIAKRLSVAEEEVRKVLAADGKL